MLLLIPLGLGMVFMITAWTYYLRVWLAAMMTNPRRRRAVIMGLSFAVLLLIQAPNLYFNLLRRDGDRPRRSQMTAEQRAARDAERSREFEEMASIQKYVPPLWVPAGAKALAEGSVWPALAGMLGCIGIGAIGLRRAYISTMRFYYGTTGGKAAARAPAQKLPDASAPAASSTARAPRGTPLIERQVPFVPDPAGALAVATLRSMLRAPEVKMQWGVSFLILIVVGGSLLFRRTPDIPADFRPFAATAAMIFSLFFMIQFLTNQFGFDREGFRALVLSPADRRMLLIGKNVATLPVPTITAVVLLVLVTIWMKLSPLMFLATFFQLVAAVLVLGLGGNLLSILLPYRIQPGTMKATKMKGLNVFFLILAQFAFPVAMSPLFLAPFGGFLSQRMGGPPAGLVTLLLSIVMAGISALIFVKALGPLGRLLQRRETKILETVTAEVE
jgi:hypothetical protein